MSAPSRGPEIRRRRTRAEKIAKLRRQYAMARNDSDRSRILGKIKKNTVGMSEQQFLQPLEAKR
jgi:hypothetical protein